MWVPRDGAPQEISTVVDERMCCSTVLRVERLGNRYVAADMVYFNGRYVWETHTFAQRSVWLKQLLDAFHTSELAQIIHKDDLDPVPVRGWELYSNSPGMRGSYVPLPQMVPTKWMPTESPDIWKNLSGTLLEVKTLELLKRLRKNPIVPSRVLEGRVEILM